MPTNESNPTPSKGKTPAKPISLGRLKQAKSNQGPVEGLPEHSPTVGSGHGRSDSEGRHPAIESAGEVHREGKAVISAGAEAGSRQHAEGTDGANPLSHSPKTEGHASKDSVATEMPTQNIVTVTLMSLLGAAGFTVALSPLGIGQIAFLITLPWAWLVIDARRLTVSSYAVLYLSGVLMWTCLLLVESSVTTPYWTAAFVQIGYLALGLPAFVFIGRLGRRLLMVPAYLWLPAVWCAIEYTRGNFLGGFALGLLGHAVADSRRVLQLSDLLGTYGLGALMVACGASVAELLWLYRRLQQLEKRMPQLVDPTAAQDADASEADAKQVLAASRSFSGRPVVRRPKQTAARSMIDALRRNRDQTRDQHLVLAVMAVTVMVAIMLFANQYGRFRAAETGAWKMFETNLFQFSVVGGPNTRNLLSRPSTHATNGVVVSALSGFAPVTHAGNMDGAKTLLIVIEEDDKWKAELRLAGMGSANGKTIEIQSDAKQSEENQSPEPVAVSEDPLTLVSHQDESQTPEEEGAESDAENVVVESGLPDEEPSALESSEEQVIAPEVMEQSSYTSMLPREIWHSTSDCLVFHPIPTDFPMRIACLRTGTATIEQSLMEILNSRGDRGKSIDAAVVVIDPGPWGASAWPRLMTRSVMASAVATRCPVVGIVPEQALSVANGDGQLFASATAPKEKREDAAVVMDLIDSDATGNSQELGEITDGLVRVQSMIDPRSSFYVRSGGWFPLFCMLLTVAMSLGGMLRSRPAAGIVG